MKKVYILLAVFYTYMPVIFGQVTEDWVSPGNYYGLDGKMVAVDADDNVFTLSDIFHGDMYLTKRDKFGNILWDTTYDNTTPSQWEEAAWLYIDPSGDAIVTGFTNTGFGTEWFAVQMVTMKFNGADGALEWRVTESTGSAHRGRVCMTDAAGNIYVGGDINAYNTTYYELGNLVVVKYSPAGIMIWKTYLDDTGVMMGGPLSAMKFDYSGNIIITGVTPFANQQHTAKITPAGVCLWHHAYSSYGAADIAINSANEIFTLGSYGFGAPTPSTDPVIRKLNASGTLLWEHNYDFGSAELGRKIVCDSYGNAVIIGYGSQLTGMPYVDWITFKINNAGTKLWDQRYNEHANNDEWPWGISIDAWDNTYVTGQGGPWPGYFWTSLTQMVTVKYTPSGVAEWTALHTTYASTGQNNCLASDNSLYAVGQGYAVTIHYDQVLPVTCEIPTGLFTNNIMTNKARLNWTLIPDAVQYEVWYKKSTAAAWKIRFVPGTSNKLNLKNLQCNKNYVWQIRTICDTAGIDILSDFSSLQNFTTLICRESEINEMQNITVYPNPASQEININYNDQPIHRVLITDLTGNQVLTAGPFNTQTAVIHIETLPSGFYIIRIESDGQWTVQQFIKSN